MGGQQVSVQKLAWQRTGVSGAVYRWSQGWGKGSQGEDNAHGCNALCGVPGVKAGGKEVIQLPLTE